MSKFAIAARFALAWLFFAATPLAAQTIISDMFSGTSGAAINGRTPDTTDLPGGTYTSWGSTGSATLNGSGSVQIGPDMGAAVSISSVEPAAMTISAGLEVGTLAGSDLGTGSQFRGTGLGFYPSAPPGGNAFSNFLGIVLNPVGPSSPAGAVSFSQSVGQTQGNLVAPVAWPTAALGTFSTTTSYVISYTINMAVANGGISNVSVTNPGTGMTDTTDFDSIDDYSGPNPFTASTTSYAGFMGTGSNFNELGDISNFLLVTANVAPPAGSAWTGAVSAVWATAGNWTGSVPGMTSGTASTDSVLFNADNLSNPTPTVDAGRNVQNITFDNTGGNLTTTLTLGTTNGHALLLTAGGAIQMNSNVVTPQVVNAPLVLEGAAAVYTFTNNSSTSSATLSFGGGITAGGSGAETLQLNGAKSGENAISGAIGDGSTGATLGLTVQAGTWALSGPNTYSGPTAVGPGATLQVTAGSLGATAISISGGAMTLAAPAASPTVAISTGSLAVNSGGSLGSPTVMIGGGSMSVNSGGAIGAASVSISAGSLLLASGATIGNAGISLTGGTLNVQPGSGTLAAGSSGTGSAGASLSIGSGASFSMVDGAIGTFNLQQQNTFPNPALTLGGGTLNFELGSGGADKLVVGAGQASVSGTNTIGITAIGSSLGAGPYTLISAPAGGLTGTFQFPGGGTTTFANASGNYFQLTLNDTNNAVTVSAAPASSYVILLDTFNVSTNTDFVDHVPDINLPNPTGTYSLQGDGAIFTIGKNNPDSYVHATGFASVGGDLGAGLPISSNGSYIKPTTMTISAGLQSNTILGGSDVWRGTGLGFYSQMVNSGSQDGYFNFQGIVLGTDGTIYLTQTGVTNPKVILEQVAWPATALGAFSTSSYYTISYTINTTAANGGISNLSISNGTVTDTADFVSIDNYAGTNLFTDADTQYAGFTGSSGSFTGNGLVQNFTLVAASAGTASYWTGMAGDSTWATAGNWSGTVPGSTTGTTNTDTALFNQTATSSPTVIDVGGRNVMNITFDTAAVSSMIIGATNGPALNLTSGGTIQTTSTVTNPQTIDAPLVLEGNYTFASGSTTAAATLSFGGGITSGAGSGTTTLTLNGSNTGANTLSGILADGTAGSNLALSVGGMGLWVLNGSTSTYSGGTTIASGATLELAGSVSALGVSQNIANSGTLMVAGGNQVVGTVLGSGSVTVSGGSLTAYQIRQNSLTIGSSATVTLSPSGSGSTTNPTGPNNINFSSALTSLTIAGTTGAWTGTLDIGNNGLVIAYGTAANDPYVMIDNMIETGFDAAHWDGQGITSSLGRAAANSHTPLNIGLEDFTPGKGNFSNTTFIVFEGQTVTTNAILIRLTYMDDIVLAGDLNAQDASSDALIFAANYGTGTTWSVGDLEHTGLVGSADALLFAANYTPPLASLDGTTGGDVALSGGIAAVPEPAGAALALLGALGLWLGKRARSHH